MKAIIFGASGQDGFYLNRLLVSQGVSVIAISRNAEDGTEGNVSDGVFVHRLIKDTQPDYIFHLAAVSTTRHTALMENHETISTGTLHILEAVKIHSPLSKVFITGSGVQFANSGSPIDEKTPFHAGNAYAVARIQSVYAARYFRELGIKTYVGYLFHHESPLRKDNHVSMMIAQKVKHIHAGISERITIGDAGVVKEWGYAKDIVQGMWTLVNQEHVYEACIGTGAGHSIQEYIDACFELIKKPAADYVETTEKPFTAEYATLVSNPEVMHSLGWKHTTTLPQLAKKMIFDSL